MDSGEHRSVRNNGEVDPERQRILEGFSKMTMRDLLTAYASVLKERAEATREIAESGHQGRDGD